MARFLRTETNSSGGHSRLREPAVVVELPPEVILPRGIEGSLAPIDSGRRVYAHSFLRPPIVVGVASTAVYSGPHVTLALSRRGKAKSRLLPVPAAFRPVGQLAVHLAPSFSVTLAHRGAKSRLTQVIYEGTSGPPIRGYLTPPLDRVPISNSILRPPTVVTQVATGTFYGPAVTLAPSRRPVAKSRLLPVPAAFRPVGQLDVHLAPSTRGKPKSRLSAPTVVGPVLARPTLVQLAYSKRGVPRSRLSAPTVVNPIQELLPRPHEGYLAPLRDWRRVYAHSFLRPPILTVAAVVYPPIKVTLVRIRPVRTQAILRGPVRQTALAVPSTVTLFPLLGRVPAVHSRLRPPETPVQKPVAPSVVVLAPSPRPIAKSRLLPVPAAFRPVGVLKVTLTNQRRVKAKSFLRGPVTQTALAVPSSVTLFPLTNRVPAVHSRLQPPATLQVVAAAVYYGPSVTLAPSRRPIAKSRLLPVPSAFQPVGDLRVTLAYSLRGKPKSRLSAPTVVGPVLARPILVHLAPSSRGKAKPHLSPPTVVAPVLARPALVKLARIRPPRTIAILRRPVDLVDRDDVGTLKVHLAYSRRGAPKSRLAPPTVISYFQARPTLVVLAPSSRGVPKSRLEPPTVVAPVLARPIDVTLAPQRRGVAKSRLRPPIDLVDQADVGSLRVHLTYSRRGTAKSILHPPVPPETFRGIQAHLTPSKRGKPRSFFIATPIARQAVELSGPKVTLVRIRPPRTISRLPQASLYQAVPKAERDLKITLAPQRRGTPKSKLRPPTVIRAATPYFRDLPITLAPQARGKAKSFLRPPVVLRQFSAAPIHVTLAPQRRGAPKSRLRNYVVAARVFAPITVTLAPQPKPRTKSRLFGYIVVAPALARPISVTLAPQPKPRTASRLRNYVVPDFVARPVSVTLARITPPPVHSRLRPPAVIGAAITYRGIQVHLAYSVRGKTMSRLSFLEGAIVECYGDAMCGFDFAADVLGSDTAPTALGTTAAGSNVRGTDVAPTVEGASAASGSVSGDDERREGC